MASTTERSPIDDLTYDVITLLQKKAKAVAALETYLDDARDDEDVYDLFAEIRRQEEEHVRLLRDVLVDRLEGADVGDDLDDEEDEDEDYDEESEELEEGTDGTASAEPPPRRGESSNRGAT